MISQPVLALPKSAIVLASVPALVFLNCSATARFTDVDYSSQSLLRQAEEAAKCEALTQMDALRDEVAAAAKEKCMADFALEEARTYLHDAWAQVCCFTPGQYSVQHVSILIVKDAVR